MRGVFGLLLVLLAFSGCIADDAPPPEPAANEEDPTTPPIDPGTDVQGHGSGQSWLPLEVVHAVHVNGSVGTFASVCTDTCVGHSVVEGENDVLVPMPDTILRAVAMNLTWTATSPATETLSFNAMVMRHCQEQGCNATSTMLGGVEGKSPLSLSFEDLDVPVTADHVVHVFAYNPMLLVEHPPAVAILSVDQAFYMSGTLHFTAQ